MFITVQLLHGYQKPLLYAVPNSWHNITNLNGKIVRVPLRNALYPAVVIKQHIAKPLRATYAIKEAVQIEPFPDDAQYHHFLQSVTNYYHVEYYFLLARVRVFLQEDLAKRKRLLKTSTTKKNYEQKKVVLTYEQQNVCDFLLPNITQQKYTPTVLHGVTGSGKTEVYKRLIEHTIAQKKSIILLLPEVTLAQQFTNIMRAELPEAIAISSFHSGTSTSEKRALWKNALEVVPQLIIGVHLPILLPLPHLGLIIIDEEHEAGYQEKKHPKINSKEVALMRAQQYNIPILLGSATPSITSLYNVKTRGWYFFQLKQRFAGNFPNVKTVFLSDKKQRKHFWISTDLYRAIKDRLIKKQQSIIFLNRRGVSFFVQCKSCSFIFECRSCSVSLTLHNFDILTCHYCGYNKRLLPTCPVCTETEFIKKGIGTQKMVTILQKLFPQARIARADIDITSKKKLWQQTVTNFTNGNLDILVGTQSITKGFHFPHVTLVGIIWADLNLHFPHYAASEQTLQQLIQVAGRAGRQSEHSTVIVQAMHNHPIFAYLNEQDYLQFYRKEIESRKSVGYPPYTRLVEIELKHTNEQIIEKESQQIAHALVIQKRTKKLDIHILGPAKPLVHKIQKNHRRTIYIKAPTIETMSIVFNTIDQSHYKSFIFWTPNPTH